MELSDIYAETRTRLVDLGPQLTPNELAAPLVATPPWTVDHTVVEVEH